MLAALADAFGERQTSTDLLLRALIGQVRLQYRQTLVDSSRQDPGDLDIPWPGQARPEKKKQGGLGALAKSLMSR